MASSSLSIRKVLFARRDESYIAYLQERLDTDMLSQAVIVNAKKVDRIPRDACSPPMLQSYTQASNPPPTGCYIKRLNLMLYEPSLDLAGLVLKDITACEILAEAPHPNLARYHGCEVRHGRVVGLFFTKYQETLMDKLNPNALNKEEFSSIADNVRFAAAEKHLPDIEKGLQHMHSLGLVHNDINPSNIMIDASDVAVVIDFDSCLPTGDSLGGIKRTFGWHDKEVHLSVPDNDWRALTELRA